MREIFTEIWSSMRKNKLRTFLTGFSVAWGILMLIILLSSGNGLQNGMMSNFDYMATNSIELYSSRTSMPYAGYAEGRSIYLSGKDIEILEEEFPNVDKVTSSAWYSGGTMTRGKNYINVSMHGVRPEHTEVFKIEILEGRFINRQDIDRQRKVCVISQPVREVRVTSATAACAATGRILQLYSTEEMLCPSAGITHVAVKGWPVPIRSRFTVTGPMLSGARPWSVKSTGSQPEKTIAAAKAAIWINCFIFQSFSNSRRWESAKIFKKPYIRINDCRHGHPFACSRPLPLPQIGRKFVSLRTFNQYGNLCLTIC